MTTPTKREGPIVVVYAPIGRDGPASAELLSRSGMDAVVCHSVNEVLRRAETDADAVFIAEEGLFGQDLQALATWVDQQPAWSDFPFVVLTSKHRQPAVAAWRQRMVAALRNVSLLERPVQSITLTSAVKAALRGRHRQYEVRALLEARERASNQLEALVVERTSELEKANQELRTQMAERAQIEETLRQAQKIEAIGQLTGGIAHDFNNLLMAVLGSLELLRRRMPADPALLRLVDNARAGAERGASLTARMLSFARKQELHKTPIDLRQLIQGMQALLLSSLGPTIQLEVELPQRLARVKTDPNQLETALLNLAANARDAMAGEGRILIVAEQVTLPGEQHGLAAGRYVRLNVSDSGTGMDETTLKRAVEPFFTTKGVGKGTGLGLSMVHGLAEQSGGRLVLRSSPGAGTTAQIWLPALEDEPAAEPTHSPLPHDLPRRTTRPLSVLAVDDDELVLFGTAGMLEAAGHHVLTARSAAQALELLQVAKIDMLVTDHAMPLMSGAQLAAEVRASRPELPILLVSGYAELPSATPALPLQRLAKPFTQDQLLDAVEQLRADVC